MKTFYCLNCNTENKTKGVQYSNKYCNNQCQRDFEYKQFIIEWKNNSTTGTKKHGTSRHIYRYLLEKQYDKCLICNISEWNGSKIVLELDHIDGNYLNNTEDNLRFLCPNCHSQTSTYKNKNSGNGRTHRRTNARFA